MVFEDASTYTCIIALSYNNDKLNFKSISPKDIFDEFVYDTIKYEKLNSDKWNLSNQGVSKILEKINQQPLRVKDVFDAISQGTVTVGDDIFMLRGYFEKDNFIGFSKELNKEVVLEKNIMKPILKGEDINRYKPLSTDLYIIYPHFLDENHKTKPYEEEEFKNKFPLVYEYLFNFKDELISKKIKYKTNPKYWYSLHRAREISIFENPKIITSYMGISGNMTFDTNEYYHNTKGYSLQKKGDVKEDYKFYLSLLNSSIFWTYIQNTSAEFRGGYFTFTTKQIEPFPLPKLENLEQQEPFIQKADLMLNLNKQLQTAKQNFLNELRLEKMPQKLQKFEALEFDEFAREYSKAKKLKFADKLEERNFKNDWSALFENDKEAVLELKAEIAKTDKEIDVMVYVLYGLSEDEIGIVEGLNDRR
jgi:hypothetical protein